MMTGFLVFLGAVLGGVGASAATIALLSRAANKWERIREEQVEEHLQRAAATLAALAAEMDVDNDQIN